jgi:hypothetical protein
MYPLKAISVSESEPNIVKIFQVTIEAFIRKINFMVDLQAHVRVSK